MSIFLQIAIPLLVTSAALIVIAVLRRFLKLETVILTLALLAIGIGMLTAGLTDPEAAQMSSPSQLNGSDNVSLVLAHVYILNGEYEAAGELLDELDNTCPGDSEIQLARARLAMLNKDYRSAVSLYQLSGKGREELASAQTLLQQTALNDNAVIAYLKEQGADPAEYGLTAIEPSNALDADEVFQDVLDAVQETMKSYNEKYSKDVVRAAEYAAEISINFHDGVKSNDLDPDSFEFQTDKLTELMEKSPELQSNAHLREIRMKGLVAQGKYEDLATKADGTSTPGELMVLTELYINDLIDDEDFSAAFQKMDRSKTRQMLNHCKTVLKANKANLSQEQYDNYEHRIGQMEEMLDDPAVFYLKTSLSKGVSSGAANMRSKLYMSLAKLSYELGNTAESDGYVQKALSTSGDSSDSSYRVPMSQIASIIQGKSDSDEVKNISQYVAEALDNSLSEGVSSQQLSSVPADDEDTDYDTDSPETDKPGESKQDFAGHMTDNVGQASAMLNIGVINKDSFPDIQARVQIQSQQWKSLEEIRKHLLVYDCGSAITQFTLEKLEFQHARIVLLCDISGSMSGNEQALKDAIIAFANNMVEGEEVSVVGFDNRIVFQMPFSSDPQVVASYAEEINIGGGTALYKSALETLDQFEADINSNDIIIAMTDGQDGSRVGEADMHNELGAKAALKGVTLYTVGLGSGVDIDYLTMMAKSCNGSFLYAETTEQMNTFFGFIHGQMKNQYILSYTALNKSRNKRTLELQIQDELGGTTKVYYLQDPVYSNTDRGSYDPYIAEDAELSIYGFSTKFLYKSTADQQLQLVGSGFDAGDTVLVRLTGSVEYQLAATFVDSQSYTVTIPAQIATGTYDLSVTVAGYNVTLQNELTVAVYGTQKTFQFGGYKFTALDSYTNNKGQIVLSGNVVMNDWLLFKGDVTVTGETHNVEWVTLHTDYGATIPYSIASAEGLAKYLAEKGIPLFIPLSGDFPISNEPYSGSNYNDFPVRPVGLTASVNALYLSFQKCNLYIYPDAVKLGDLNFDFNLPFQKQLLRNFDPGDDKQVKSKLNILFTNTKISIKGDVKYEELKDAPLTMISFPLLVKEFTAKIDTLKNNYTLSAEVTIKSLKDSGSLVLEFGIAGGRFDAIGLQVKSDKISVPLVAAPIPISMKDFGVKAAGFSKYESDQSTLSNVLSTKVTALFQVDVANLNTYLPKITKLISKDKDVALASLEDCELSFELKEFRLGFEADVVLATVLKLGKCEIELGKFDYTNALIGYHNKTQYGLRAKLTQTAEWKTDEMELKLEGATELTLGYPYSGLWFSGDVNFEVGWWFVKVNTQVSGDAMLGVFQNSSDNTQFSVIVRGTTNSGAPKGFRIDITKANGFDLDVY